MHELSIKSNGEAEAFFAGNGKELNPAWHGLGTNVIDAVNSEEAIKLAGLDWQVRKVPAFAETWDDTNPHVMVRSDDYYATVRADNQFVLGFVGSDYVPVQNFEAFDFMDGLNQDGIVKYESAGALKSGRVVWILARTGSVFEVAAGDAVQPYVLFSTRHDGKGGIRVMPTTVRVVCANTLRIALGQDTLGLTLRHDGTVMNRLAAVRNILKLTTQRTTARLEQARELVKKQVNKDEFQSFVDSVLPIPEDAEKPALRMKAREHVAWNFYSNPRQNLPGIERSAWSAYNAVSEFVDHAAKFRTSESRFTSVMEGGADEVKQTAFKAALALL